MRLVLVGAGPVGRAAAAAAVADCVVESVIGVVDPDEAARRAASAELGDAPGYPDLGSLPPGRQGDAAIVAFTSSGEASAAAIVELLSLGYHAVTTCEELADPGPHVRRGIETSAHSDGRIVVATGANPGFVMDRLAVVAGQASRGVRSVAIQRVVDTSDRRATLVAKTGHGLTPDEFAAGVAERRLGHVGMLESARLVADGLGWTVQGATESIDPVLEDGRVAGLHQVARLHTTDGRTVTLDLVMAWRAPDPHDEVVIDGEPPIRVRVEGGYHGDQGTTASVVRAVGLLPHLAPGFYRPIDLPLRPLR